MHHSGTVKKTLGGGQFWADVFALRGWRIQMFHDGSRFRLLDSENRRHASGSREECVAAWNTLREQHGVADYAGHVVVALHGIIRSARCWKQLSERLAAHQIDVVPVDYPSTRWTIRQSADVVRELIAALPAERITIVGHSMGGLVTRSLFAQEVDPRIERIVMLGTPNHGAELADWFGDWFTYKAIMGRGGQELSTGSDGVIAALPIPTVPFGLVGGVRGNGRGNNFFLRGEDDGIVRLRSVYLSEAEDFVTVRGLHSFLNKNPAALDMIEHYVTEGCFPETATRPDPAWLADASADVLPT